MARPPSAGNLKVEIDNTGFNLKDIFLVGTLKGKLGPWERSYQVKYSVLNGALTTGAEFARDSPFGPTPDPGLPQMQTEHEGFTRTYLNSDGWLIEDVGDVGEG